MRKSQTQKLLELKEEIEDTNNYIKLLGSSEIQPPLYIDIDKNIKLRQGGNIVFEKERSDREYLEFLVRLLRLTIK